MESSVFIFESTRAVIMAERVCRGNRLECKVIPAPREISTECGMSLSVENGELEKAISLLNEAGVTFKVHYAGEKPSFDLLTTVEQGGCSSKLPPSILIDAIGTLRKNTDKNLIVGMDTCDDAGAYRLTDEIAIIETIDFFPPVCSSPYEFGQIAAANALSDVFAMGGKILTAMNVVMFPSRGIYLEVLNQILKGGHEKVEEAGGIIIGGHTINDYPPKYGLSVTGIVHPRKIITNSNALPDQVLILTKPLGTGTIIAGYRIGKATTENYRSAVYNMKQLNRIGAEIMQEFSVRCATDITGFGLLGHAFHIARESKVTIEIDSRNIPRLHGAIELIELGCIPGATFRNMEFVEKHCRFSKDLPYSAKILALDPQTSGGLLMSVPKEIADDLVKKLTRNGYPSTSIIGRTKSYSGNHIELY